MGLGLDSGSGALGCLPPLGDSGSGSQGSLLGFSDSRVLRVLIFLNSHGFLGFRVLRVLGFSMFSLSLLGR